MHIQDLASSPIAQKETTSEQAIKKRSMSPVQDSASVGKIHQDDLSSSSSLTVVTRQPRQQQ